MLLFYFYLECSPLPFLPLKIRPLLHLSGQHEFYFFVDRPVGSGVIVFSFELGSSGPCI